MDRHVICGKICNVTLHKFPNVIDLFRLLAVATDKGQSMYKFLQFEYDELLTSAAQNDDTENG